MLGSAKTDGRRKSEPMMNEIKPMPVFLIMGIPPFLMRSCLPGALWEG
jgi:hypothetical protein